MQREALIPVFFFCVFPALPQSPPAPAVLARQVTEKFGRASDYTLEGGLELSRKSGEQPMDVVAKGKVHLTVAPGGKYHFQASTEDNVEFVAVCDGQTYWTYLPALNQYTAAKAALSAIDASPSDVRQTLDRRSDPRILDEFSRRVVPTLARLVDAGSEAFLNGSVGVKYEGQAHAWPVLTVVSNHGQLADHRIVYLTLDPITLTIGRMIWIVPVRSDSAKVVLRLAVAFDRFRVAEKAPDSEFSFSPPVGSKRVEVLDLTPHSAHP